MTNTIHHVTGSAALDPALNAAAPVTTTTTTTAAAAATTTTRLQHPPPPLSHSTSSTATATTPHVSSRWSLLTGLAVQHEPGRRLVQQCLKQESAVYTLQRAWRRYQRSRPDQRSATQQRSNSSKRRKTKRRVVAASSSSRPTTTTTTLTTTGEHGLCQSLRSPCAAERLAAMQLIWSFSLENNIHLDCKQQQQPLLVRIWIRLLDRHVVEPGRIMEPHSSCCPSSRLALEWTAVLQETLLTWSSSASSNKDGHALQLLLPHWKWLCKAVWTLASNNTTNHTNTTALTALVHVVYLLCLRGPDRATLELFHEKCLWNTGSSTNTTLAPYPPATPPQTPFSHTAATSTTGAATTTTTHNNSNVNNIQFNMSPLACLIGAYYSVAYQHHYYHGSTSSSSTGNGSYQAAQQASHLLRRLIDPAVQPVVVVHTNSPTMAAVRDDDAAAAAAHGKTNPTAAVAPPLRRLVEGYDSDYQDDQDDDNDNDQPHATNKNGAAAHDAMDLDDDEEDDDDDDDDDNEDDHEKQEGDAQTRVEIKQQRSDTLHSNVLLAATGPTNNNNIINNNNMDSDEDDIDSVVEEEDDEEEDEVGGGGNGIVNHHIQDICVDDDEDDDDDEEEFDDGEHHVNVQEDDDDDDDEEHHAPHHHHHHQELAGVMEQDMDEDGPVAMDLEELTAVVHGTSATHQATGSSSNPAAANHSAFVNTNNSTITTATTANPSPATLIQRQRLYVAACMQVLGTHYPHQHNHHGPTRQPYLNLAGEHALIKSINKIIKPPKKALHTKIILRRAPTQEEFFRGSLSQNPIAMSSLKPAAGVTCQKDAYEPTVADLRQHIANDLQMADSAELIEVLVANKILDVRLKLRVVHQVLWRRHVRENPSTGLASYLSSSSGGTVFSRGGSGLSIFFSSDPRGGEEQEEPRVSSTITDDTPASALPSLLATYRLAGVDGEATEDTVNLEDLVDPEAPAETANLLEREKQLEEEYGITSLVATEGRGVYVLLRSVQHTIMDVVIRIRRDDVGCVGENPTRKKFKQSPPCQALSLLLYCTRLPRNRKKLLQARAPTILLTLLLEVLKALETGESSSNQISGGNPTAEVLQELIESLTSDISTSSTTDSSMESGYESDMAQDAASMPLLLQHIETISLSPPLRSIIAKLLPFLTYGQVDLSRDLAQHFDRHISLDALAEAEAQEEKASHLMQTFVDTAVSLPATGICNSLRRELITCGFIDRLAAFAMKDMPKSPPTWSPALWADGELPAVASSSKKKADPKKKMEDGWRAYFMRQGVGSVFKILTGLCKKHASTQTRIAEFPEFLQGCHWIEATSDNAAANITTNGLGLLAETLLDEAMVDNEKVAKRVDGIRQTTKFRKRSIAEQRRKQALVKMHSLGAPAGTGVSTGDASRQQASSVRDAAASIFAPMLGLFGNAGPTNVAASASGGGSASKSKSNKKKKDGEQKKKPAWLAEAESMVEETGLKCAVCQEGRTLQPKELLGLYITITKVTLPNNRNYLRTVVDGTELLKALPAKMPAALVGDPIAEDWYAQGVQAKAAVESLSVSSQSSGARRNIVFTTTTSAGNAIHISCHRRARQADRNHPKAPKSEWEGASLRNNRVNCNAILPLVSSKSSSVPLMHVNAGLSDYQAAVANILGTSPPNMLWPILYDIRFLLLRMAYGESLNADSGGGSLASNCQLLFYQFRMAEMLDRDAQLDQRAQSQHARGLSAGCLLASSLLFRKDVKSPRSEMARGVADAVPMAALTSIVFHNSVACGSRQTSSTSASSGSTGSINNNNSDKPHPKREWMVGRELFLRGLLMCAGRRHVLNLNSSGCQSSRNLSGRKRSSSFADWDETPHGQDDEDDEQAEGERRDIKPARRRPGRSSSSSPTVEDFQNAFRPMITLFAILDQLSSEFAVGMDDSQIEESGQRVAAVIENCQRSRSIHELIRRANVPLDNAQMMDLLQKGMVLA